MLEWIKKQAPTRESFERSRFLRPYAKRIFVPALWRFTRRSVPRGVALGLLVGIFLLVPGVQIAAAALLALPVRANIPIAAAMTFISIPPTTIFVFLPGAIWVSNALLGLHADLATFNALRTRGAPLGDWAAWLFSDVALGLIAGLFIISVVCAALGYVIAALAWRWRLATKWRARGHARITVGR